MSSTKRTTRRAKRSVALRLMAVIGWLALKMVKVAWKVLALTGSHLAKRKLAEIDRRRTSPASASAPSERTAA